MISQQEKEKIISIAKEYELNCLYLFGSNLNENEESNDIDLAVEGIDLKYFFEFYGKLIFSISKPVDLIDLTRDSKFNTMIKEEAVILYERSKKKDTG
ncbi:MAG: hypothetical protein V1872_06230 [bacterium]